MALIDRTTKPPVGTPLRSDGHWSVTGLGIAFPFNETSGISVTDAVSGTVSTHTRDQADVGPVTVDGRLLFQSGADGAGAGIPVTTGNIPSNAATLVCGHIVHTTNGTLEDVFGGIPGGTLLTTRKATASKAATLCYETSHGWVVCADGSGLAVGAATGSATFATEVYNIVAGVYDGGFKIYQNGTLKGQNNFSLTGSFSTPFDGDGYRIADNVYWSQSAHLFLDFVYAYTRALSDAEIASLSANPWQIFEQISDGGGGATYNQAVAGGFPAPGGSAAHQGSFGEALAGNLPAPSGGIVKRTGKIVTGAVPAAGGATVKRTAKALAGSVPSANGNAMHGAVFHVSVSGIMGIIAGTVATVLNPVVIAAKGLLKVIGSGFKKIIGG